MLADAERFVLHGRSQKVRLNDPDEDANQVTTTSEVTFSGRKVTQFDFSKMAPRACHIYGKTKELKSYKKPKRLGIILAA